MSYFSVWAHFDFTFSNDLDGRSCLLEKLALAVPVLVPERQLSARVAAYFQRGLGYIQEGSVC